MGTRREVRDEGEGDPVGIELPAGCVGHDPDAVAVDDEPGVGRLAARSGRGCGRSSSRRPSTSSPTRSAPFSGLRRDEGGERRDREHGRRVAKAHLPRAVEEARHDALRRSAPARRRRTGRVRRNGTPSSAGSVRRPRRSAARSTSVPGAGFEIEMEAVSGSIDEIGVLRLLAEAPVEPVRELRRAHRAEPVGDVDARGASRGRRGAEAARRGRRRARRRARGRGAAGHRERGPSPARRRAGRSGGSSAPREPARPAAPRRRPRRASSHRRRPRRSSSRPESSCARTGPRRPEPQPRPRR